MATILVATEKPFAPVAVDQIRKIVQDGGHTFALLEKYTDKADFKQAVSAADALIVRSDIVDEEIIRAGARLKIVVRAGAGFDNIDLKASTASKIVVMNTPGQNSNAVAELALGMMVYLARNQFNGTAGTELLGKTLGIHAYGNVGRHVARIARGFNMKLLAYDPFVDGKLMEKDGVVHIGSVQDLYARSQYVSLHIPATPETKNSINFDLMNLMPKGATLVNTARKEVVDEVSLLKIFQSREDFRYGTDIAPDCAPELIQQYPERYYGTPKKMGAQTKEANVNAGLAAARQIVNFFATGDKTFQVN